jgi:eukaryotic-like serine/threonine-protein kinase
MPLDQDTINTQLELLATHRRRLDYLFQQQAKLGAHTPYHIITDVEEAQADIRRIKGQLRADGVPVEDEPNDEVRPSAVAVSSRLSPQELRNRNRMLTKVKTIWIEGLLEQSLAKELRIALNLTEQPDAVDLPLNALVQELNHPPQPLRPGMPIIDVFGKMGKELLILGAPGVGKTTLLLELTRDLIAHAELDEADSIPVIFNLSSWAGERGPLKGWLVEELNTKYDVPKKIGQEWIDTNAILLLLDGLDEVAEAQREACVEAINDFRQKDGGLAPIVVCSRSKEYKILTTKLRLQSAIVVHMLSRQQVANYLEQVGEKAAGIRAALYEDVNLLRMLRTPLMLSIATLAYAGTSPITIPATGNVKIRRQQLLDAYIEKMFQRHGKQIRYSQQRTLRSLGWLAHRMTQQAQTMFLIESLQPEWLSARAERLQYVLLDRCIGGLVFGLVFGLIYGLVLGLVYGLVFGLFGGLRSGLFGGLVYGLVIVPIIGMLLGLLFGLVTPFFGGQRDIETLQQRSMRRIIFDALVGGLVGGLVFELVFGLFGELLSGRVGVLSQGLSGGLFGGLFGGLLGVLTGKAGVYPRRVIVVERLHWVWSKAWRSAASGLVFGLGIGLILGLALGLYDWLAHELVDGLGIGLGIGLRSGLSIGPFFGLLLGLVGGLSSGPLAATIRVNQGIRRSARSALLGGLVTGLVFELLFGLYGGRYGGLGSGVSYALCGGLLGGLGGALSFGGYTCLSHLTLRLVLYRNGSLPFRLIPFLDYCAERIFLRRVGGGYIFVHRLLMEHFAAQEPQVEHLISQIQSSAWIIPGPPRGQYRTWICSNCGGFVRQDAVFCKHCKSNSKASNGSD